MPTHDWTRVDQGVFHAFHVQWISALSDALNRGGLPADHYAMIGQRSSVCADAQAVASPFLSGPVHYDGRSESVSDDDIYSRKQNVLGVRRSRDDRVVAVIEIVSPGNKSSAKRFRDFVDKATTLIANDVHLLVIDLFPPGSRDPSGVHGAISYEQAGRPYDLPADKPLAAASYEAHNGAVRAFVRHMAVGEPVPDVPLFLAYNACVQPPLAATYDAAYAVMPLRWRAVLERA